MIPEVHLRAIMRIKAVEGQIKFHSTERVPKLKELVTRITPGNRYEEISIGAITAGKSSCRSVSGNQHYSTFHPLTSTVGFAAPNLLV
jgi:hypothetical protein